MPEKLDVIVARIDENVKHIVDKIEDHEKRIRNNERFKQRTYGALGILGVAVSIIVLVVGWIIIS